MFAIKDLESIKNLAAVLVIPFFSAAYVSDGALETIKDPVLDWLRASDSSIVSAAGWTVWFLIVIGIVTALLAAFDSCVVWLHVALGDNFVMAWFGFACLTAGLFILSLVMPGIPKSPFNPLWHLAFLCYGFGLIDRAAK